MSGVINYTRVNFKDYPDKTTPITAANLNKLDKGVYDLDLALKETNDLLGTASQASGVAGATAFAKINKLNSDLTNVENAINKGYVEVLADGVKTYATLLNELYALADLSKLSATSKFEIINTDGYKYDYWNVTQITPNSIQFSIATVTSDGEYVGLNTLKSTGSTAEAGRLNTKKDMSSTVPTSTHKYRILY